MSDPTAPARENRLPIFHLIALACGNGLLFLIVTGLILQIFPPAPESLRLFAEILFRIGLTLLLLFFAAAAIATWRDRFQPSRLHSLPPKPTRRKKILTFLLLGSNIAAALFAFQAPMGSKIAGAAICLGAIAIAILALFFHEPARLKTDPLLGIGALGIGIVFALRCLLLVSEGTAFLLALACAFSTWYPRCLEVVFLSLPSVEPANPD